MARSRMAERWALHLPLSKGWILFIHFYHCLARHIIRVHPLPLVKVKSNHLLHFNHTDIAQNFRRNQNTCLCLGIRSI
jgi:hypothetical protein